MYALSELHFSMLQAKLTLDVDNVYYVFTSLSQKKKTWSIIRFVHRKWFECNLRGMNALLKEGNY